MIDLLLEYVSGARPDFSLAGTRHRKRRGIVARTAREIFEKEHGVSPETWLAELRQGKHDRGMWLVDMTIAQRISRLDPLPKQR